MPNKEFKVCCIYIPNSGLTIYDGANGSLQGQIYLGKPDHNNEFYTAFIKKNELEKNLNHMNFTMVGYEERALVFIDSKSGFVKINNGYWIDTEELKSKGLQLVSWFDYALNKNTEWYANQSGLNLREGPSINNSKIITLKGELFGISLTSERKGKWNKVKVTKYWKPPCSGEDNLVIKTYTGWVKLISEEGELNVWYPSKGC